MLIDFEGLERGQGLFEEVGVLPGAVGNTEAARAFVFTVCSGTSIKAGANNRVKAGQAAGTDERTFFELLHAGYKDLFEATACGTRRGCCSRRTAQGILGSSTIRKVNKGKVGVLVLVGSRMGIADLHGVLGGCTGV